MKVAIISDTHLGDPACILLGDDGKPTDVYEKLLAAVRGFTGGTALDYLVLNGDVLDFSVRPFHEALETAKPFFRALAKDKVAEQLIYIPGNRDKHVWDAVEWQTSIIRSLEEHREPKAFRRTVPGLLDFTANRLELHGVKADPDTNLYGDIFLKGLFEEGSALPINVVYPNLYLRGSSGETCLVTHGHMLELAWVLLSELLQGHPAVSGRPSIAQLEEHNIPITSMVCTGVGQSGDVTRLFHAIQQEAKAGQSQKLQQVLDSVLPTLDQLVELPWYAELLDDALLAGLRRAALQVAENTEDARYDREYFERPSVRKRFQRFYVASCAQAEQDLHIPRPTHFLFGHIHQRIPASDPKRFEDGRVTLYNCGGWLDKENGEVFFLGDDATISGQQVRG